MNKLKLFALLCVSALSILPISCQQKTSKETSKTDYNLNLKKEYFNKLITKEALELKALLRKFNFEYYPFYQNYNVVRTALNELIEEQSLETNKEELQNYYNSHWFNKEANNLTDFSKLLFEFNDIFKATLDALSNLNFYLEQFDFESKKYKNLSIDEFKSKIKQEYNQYIHNNSVIDTNKLKRVPLKNLINLLKNKLKEIKAALSDKKLDLFEKEYQKVKGFIYDNVNRINLDDNIKEIVETLKNNNKNEYL
ncbi:thymidylate synthase family protein [Metamycoplasma gateae]|uniref:Lipoprotein n=1 Tax=Metamycoplasma gateae TaxID=35769 RepID=A0ABZ2AKM6_9BACT|nr:hypothetical protein V2E26_02800 [Metamycoplasma gateae]